MNSATLCFAERQRTGTCLLSGMCSSSSRVLPHIHLHLLTYPPLPALCRQECISACTHSLGCVWLRRGPNLGHLPRVVIHSLVNQPPRCAHTQISVCGCAGDRTWIRSSIWGTLISLGPLNSPLLARLTRCGLCNHLLPSGCTGDRTWIR